jgi:hypothetical protein
MYLTRRYVERQLGSNLMLWIDPARITYDAGQVRRVLRFTDYVLRPLPFGRYPATLVNRIALRYEPFLITPNDYKVRRSITAIYKYKKIEDFIANRRCVDKSIWYRAMMSELSRRGFARHKGLIFASKEDVEQFFRDYVLDLVESMANEGYVLQKGRDIGAALIGDDGSIHKTNSANHRFYVARIIGTKPFPIKVIGIHRAWFHRHAGKKAGLDKVTELLKGVEERFS